MPIKLKRSSVAAKVPTTAQVDLGELALNTYDGKLYTKKDNGTASIVEIGGASGHTHDERYYTESEIDAALATKAAVARTITAAGLATGGGDLTADRTITVSAASEPEYRAGIDTSKALTTKIIYDAATVKALTEANTIAIDLSNGFHFGGASEAPLPLTTNCTLGAPTNVKSGKTGVIWVVASGATRTLTLNSAWTLAAGVETGPYAVAAGKELGVAYLVRGSTVIVTSIIRRL